MQAGAWDAVGRVRTGTGPKAAFCTGTLIASDIVLTAAHCLYDAEGAAIPAAALQFRTGDAAEVGVADWAATSGYRDEGEIRPGAAAIRNDVALLLLAEPLARDAVVPIALHPGLLRTNEVRVVSYGDGNDTRLSLSKPCRLLHRFADGVMEFDCTVSFGASGAPVLAERAGRLSILSVISAVAHSEEDGGLRTYGTTLPGHVAMLKDRLAQGPGTPLSDVGARRIGVGDRTSGGARFVRP